MGLQIKKSNNWKGINQRKKFRFVNEFIVEFSKEHVVEFYGQTTLRLLYYKEVMKNFKNLQENACAEVTFLITLQAGRLQLCQKRLRHRCFPVKVTNFLKTPIFRNIFERLLLTIRAFSKSQRTSKFFTSEAIPHKISSGNPIQVFIWIT